MYTTLASVQTICLRCQVRLSCRARLRHAQCYFRKSSTVSHEPRAPEKEVVNLSIRYHGGKSKHLKKRYGPSGDERFEDSATLGITSLGKPSKVIVMRDTDSKRTPKKPVWRSVMLKEPRKTSLSQETIVEIVKSEGDAPDQQQIHTNIESLRKNMSGSNDMPISVSKTEYEDVYDILYKGYTVEQLETYLKLTESSARAPRNQMDKKKKSIFIQQSIWKPGESPLSQRLPIEEDQKVESPDSRSRKGALVAKLMQDQWRVHVLDTESAIGELEVRVRPWQFSLLSLGQPSSLEQIRDRRKAKIEGVLKSDVTVIRITTDLRTARNTVQDIDAVLSNIYSKRIDIRPFKRSFPNPNLLDGRGAAPFHERSVRDIESFTRTKIDIDQKKFIVLNSVSQSDLDDAQRMILPLLHLPKRVSSYTEVDDEQSILIPSFVPFHGRPFFRESELLSRWTRPSERLTTKKTKSTEENERLQEPSLVPSLNLVRKLVNRIYRKLPKGTENSTRFWDPTPAASISAKFGYMLYPHGHENSNNPGNSALSGSKAVDINFDRNLTFSPTSNGLLPFLKSLGPSRNGWHTVLKVTLIPSPFTREEHGAVLKYPEIVLSFNVSPASLQLKGIYAILDQSHTNVPLPSRTLDLRLVTKWLMKGSVALHEDPKVTKFCRELQQSYSQPDSKLRAPPTLELPIPRTIAEPSLAWKPRGQRKKIKRIWNPVVVQYTFASLEQHQKLLFDFDGHSLEYTGIEGGRIGGSYSEVEMSMRTPTPESWQQATITSKSDYIRPEDAPQKQEPKLIVSKGKDKLEEEDIREGEDTAEDMCDDAKLADSIEEKDLEEDAMIEDGTTEEGIAMEEEMDDDLTNPLNPPAAQKEVFIKSVFQLVEIASNPQTWVHKQPTGWFAGGMTDFTPVQKYAVGPNENEYGEDTEPEISIAEKTVTDVTNERINDWLKTREQEERKQKQVPTVLDLLNQMREEGDRLEALEAEVNAAGGNRFDGSGENKAEKAT